MDIASFGIGSDFLKAINVRPREDAIEPANDLSPNLSKSCQPMGEDHQFYTECIPVASSVTSSEGESMGQSAHSEVSVGESFLCAESGTSDSGEDFQEMYSKWQAHIESLNESCDDRLDVYPPFIANGEISAKKERTFSFSSLADVSIPSDGVNADDDQLAAPDFKKDLNESHISSLELDDIIQDGEIIIAGKDLVKGSLDELISTDCADFRSFPSPVGLLEKDEKGLESCSDGLPDKDQDHCFGKSDGTEGFCSPNETYSLRVNGLYFKKRQEYDIVEKKDTESRKNESSKIIETPPIVKKEEDGCGITGTNATPNALESKACNTKKTKDSTIWREITKAKTSYVIGEACESSESLSLPNKTCCGVSDEREKRCNKERLLSSKVDSSGLGSREHSPDELKLPKGDVTNGYYQAATVSQEASDLRGHDLMGDKLSDTDVKVNSFPASSNSNDSVGQEITAVDEESCSASPYNKVCLDVRKGELTGRVENLPGRLAGCGSLQMQPEFSQAKKETNDCNQEDECYDLLPDYFTLSTFNPFKKDSDDLGTDAGKAKEFLQSNDAETSSHKVKKKLNIFEYRMRMRDANNSRRFSAEGKIAEDLEDQKDSAKLFQTPISRKESCASTNTVADESLEVTADVGAEERVIAEAKLKQEGQPKQVVFDHIQSPSVIKSELAVCKMEKKDKELNESSHNLSVKREIKSSCSPSVTSAIKQCDLTTRKIKAVNLGKGAIKMPIKLRAVSIGKKSKDLSKCNMMKQSSSTPKELFISIDPVNIKTESSDAQKSPVVEIVSVAKRPVVVPTSDNVLIKKLCLANMPTSTLGHSLLMARKSKDSNLAENKCNSSRSSDSGNSSSTSDSSCRYSKSKSPCRNSSRCRGRSKERNKRYSSRDGRNAVRCRSRRYGSVERSSRLSEKSNRRWSKSRSRSKSAAHRRSESYSRSYKNSQSRRSHSNSRRSYSFGSRSRSRSSSRSRSHSRRPRAYSSYGSGGGGRVSCSNDSFSPHCTSGRYSPSLCWVEKNDAHLYLNGDRRSAAMNQNIEKARQQEERRVVYVGNIQESITREDLRKRFHKFGPIEDVSVHFRSNADNYGFVTFAFGADAAAAIEKGNDDDTQPKYTLCYGGRRAFCRQRYSDLDATGYEFNNAMVFGQFGSLGHPVPTTPYTMDYDSLLRQALSSKR